MKILSRIKLLVLSCLGHHTVSVEQRRPLSVASGMPETADQKEAAVIRPFEFSDEVTGDAISVTVNERYSIITVNRRSYYFRRETGEFDGAATSYRVSGPIAI